MRGPSVRNATCSIFSCAIFVSRYCQQMAPNVKLITTLDVCVFKSEVFCEGGLWRQHELVTTSSYNYELQLVSKCLE